MTYTPKPGDRVTSPMLIGEWVVRTDIVVPAPPHYTWVQNTDTGEILCEVTARLTPVAAPLPPEPAVGSVVRAHGRLWQRNFQAWTWYESTEAVYEKSDWPGLATAPDLSPVVAVDDLGEWLHDEAGQAVADRFHAEFGGWDK